MNPFPVYLAANKSALGVARDVDTSDFHVECIDLLGSKVDGDIGVAHLVAYYSILRKASPVAGLLVMGDLSIQGSIKPVRSLVAPRKSPWTMVRERHSSLSRTNDTSAKSAPTSSNKWTPLFTATSAQS